MALFIGKAVNKVDRKGRCSFPASFRTSIQKDGQDAQFYIFPSFKSPCLEGADVRYFADLVDGMHHESAALYGDMLDLAREMLGEAELVSWDGDGRIVLPQGLRESVGITAEARFVGVGRSFEIWQPDTYAAHKQGVGAATLMETIKRVGGTRRGAV